MAHDFAELALVPVEGADPPNAFIQRAAPSVVGCGAAAAGPGWFDSSWDLRRGLEVKEGWPGDRALRAWLDDFLGVQRAAGRIASPSASTAMA